MNNEEFFSAVDKSAVQAIKELHERWNAWEIDPTSLEMHEAIGALMARQVTLFTQMAKNPGIWNGHIAPLILRSMIDNHITLSWIFAEPLERSKKFIYYGLGQEKLYLEHLKATLSNQGKDPDEHPYAIAITKWIESQRWLFLTDVNIGSWSGKSTRAMAEEAGCMDLYNHSYQPFSAAVHGMWHHVAKYNLIYCENPLHKGHRVPVISELSVDADYLFQSAKYLKETFTKFDEGTGANVESNSFIRILEEAFREFFADNNKDELTKDDS